MSEMEVFDASENVTNVMTAQYVPAQTLKTHHILSNIVLIFVLIAISIRILHKDSIIKAFSETVSAISFFIIILGIFEIIFRTYHCGLEFTVLQTKYEGSVEKVFSAFNLTSASWIFIMFSIVAFLSLHVGAGNTVERIWNSGPKSCLVTFVISCLVGHVIGLRDSGSNTSQELTSVGIGMAYSYFYGYLKIVLPSDGNYNKGIYAKMEQYENEQNVTIPVKKLFILMPKSSHIPPDLSEASNRWLEGTKSLESEVRDIAGVKRRSYHNTVYKIHPGGEGKNHRPVYVATEGATPMLTLWEILQHSHPQTNLYREHQAQIVASFHETLEMLLNNDPRCRDACELIFYNDYDANGKKVNVGEILLRKIREQATTSV